MGWHSRGYLPHFDSPQVVQTITFRLADSLPKILCDDILRAADGATRLKAFEAIMDSGRGACLLREPAIARIIEDALRHFDGERYRLLVWVVMPNHVHVMIEQIEGFRLSDVVRSWKSYTAKAVNALRKSSGAVWAPDYFDRFVRNERHFANALRYIEENPVTAGLAPRAEDWPYSSAKRR
jgi:REP element-mobilizing transposase RayT